MTDSRASDSNMDVRVEKDDRPSRESGVSVLDTEALFAGGSEVRLVHRGQEYRLRITRQGKLILTK